MVRTSDFGIITKLKNIKETAKVSGRTDIAIKFEVRIKEFYKKKNKSKKWKRN